MLCASGADAGHTHTCTNTHPQGERGVSQQEPVHFRILGLFFLGSELIRYHVEFQM